MSLVEVEEEGDDSVVRGTEVERVSSGELHDLARRVEYRSSERESRRLRV